MSKRTFAGIVMLLMVTVVFFSACDEQGRVAAEGESESADSIITVVDGLGREVSVPFNPEYVICSGPGCLRLLTYLQAQERIVAVDDMEGRRPAFDARPYALANPWFADMPLFGEFRGHDNAELIAALDPQPQVIFKTYPMQGTDPVELEEKTGIPVVALNYGDLSDDREELFTSLRIMGSIMDSSERAEEVIDFFTATIADLENRTSDIPQEERPSCYVGGIAFRGPHGFQSTEPSYPPFLFVNAGNVALACDDGPQEHADVAKEQIVAWDPDFIFVDVSTMQSDPQTSAFYQLETDPAYGSLSAVENGEVYNLLPYNWYTMNYGSILADAYFVGKTLYPDRFEDVDPEAKADEVYTFLVDHPAFRELDSSFSSTVFQRVEL